MQGKMLHQTVLVQLLEMPSSFAVCPAVHTVRLKQRRVLQSKSEFVLSLRWNQDIVQCSEHLQRFLYSSVLLKTSPQGAPQECFLACVQTRANTYNFSTSKIHSKAWCQLHTAGH